MANDSGLGSNNMSKEDKDRIHSMGGKASHSASSTSKASNDKDVITNHAGGGALDKEAQRKGGKSSHKSE